MMDIYRSLGGIFKLQILRILQERLLTTQFLVQICHLSEGRFLDTFRYKKGKFSYGSQSNIIQHNYSCEFIKKIKIFA